MARLRHEVMPVPSEDSAGHGRGTNQPVGIIDPPVLKAGIPPHESIQRDSREMDILSELEDGYKTLPELRASVDYDSVGRYVCDLHKMGFAKRRKVSGEKVRYRATSVGLAVLDYYNDG